MMEIWLIVRFNDLRNRGVVFKVSTKKAPRLLRSALPAESLILFHQLTYHSIRRYTSFECVSSVTMQLDSVMQVHELTVISRYLVSVHHFVGGGLI